MPLTLFASRPPVIAALHLPDFALSRHRSVAWYEDYAVTNARVFAAAGIPWIKLQDQTRTAGPATPDTLALMASLGRLIRAEVPGLGLGIIIEAHDPVAALSVAHAAGADFVRLKVFVGGAMTAEGPRHGLGAAAVAYRAALGRPDIAILADVHDRTARPLSDEPQPFAANWAAKVGADGLIITGGSFADTLDRIAAVRKAVPGRPILIGGGVTEDNAAQALAASDGVIVSSALMRAGAGDDDILRWDADLCRRFMDAAGGA
ncbi:BtpA/SgcQ family protein [Roseicyclus persicicus]|uniref:Phosphoric monoester hydrolase n=1 Tax=Roseicyclus persicicus TaxID=2650661 RepID=A0A7X6JY06_9RHOB|nr:BtpA/SgcQ family protein [Roseibacterium persicicum]NKX43615.1 phosphoric monoester hydrolase [Roseibacterium persicicum]